MMGEAIPPLLGSGLDYPMDGLITIFVFFAWPIGHPSKAPWHLGLETYSLGV
jgi:hypothetical protein